MTTHGGVAIVCLIAACWLWISARGSRRLAQVSRRGSRSATAAVQGRSPPGLAGDRRAVLIGGVAAGLAVAVVVEGWSGVLGGLVIALVAIRLLGRLRSRAAVRREEQLQAAAPLAGDLLAAALESGADPRSAVRAVGAALGGPLGDELERVVRAMDLGSEPRDAWASLLALSAMAGLARPLARASERGTPSAASVARGVEELRRASRARAAAAAEVVAVRAVGPLGLCFLPAFVLLGVVPFVAGAVRAVLVSI